MKNCTRFFTQEQIDEIRMRLAAIFGAKDSQFDQATYVGSNDYVAIVQNGKNKKASVNQLRDKMIEFDSTPTQGSDNAVTSNGIYEAIQNIIDQIIPGVSRYLYISTESEMFDYLLNGVKGVGRDGNLYNGYCNQVYNCIKDGYFIVIDNAICLVTNVSDSPESFQLYCISDNKYIKIGAAKTINDNFWYQIPGENSLNTNRFLIDNNYLRQNNYIDQAALTRALSEYIKNRDLQLRTDTYPILGSTDFVTSGGIWQAIQNAVNSIFIEDEVLIITDNMMELLMTGVSNPQTDDCCNTIFNACENKMLIVYQDGICKYVMQETDSLKAFSLSIITTTNQYLASASFDKTVETAQWLIGQHSLNNGHLLKSSELTNTLLSYYTKAQIDALLTTINGYILSNRTSISDHYREYLSRMESTPKYHNGSWLTDEVDSKGRVTNESTTGGATPSERFGSLWWAIKQNKLITYYGIPDIYRTSNIEGNDPDNVTSATVKFLINDIVTTFIIEKQYTGDNVLYLQVTMQESPLYNGQTRVGKAISNSNVLTVVGNHTTRMTIDTSNKLSEHLLFGDFSSINDVPKLIETGDYEDILGDVTVVSSNGLDTEKTDYANLCSLFGNAAMVIYGSMLQDNGYLIGAIHMGMNEDDELILYYTDSETNTHYEINTVRSTNSDIVAFLNAILRKSNLINDNRYLTLLLAAFKCTVEVTTISSSMGCFIRTNGTYLFNLAANLPEMEIAEL